MIAEGETKERTSRYEEGAAPTPQALQRTVEDGVPSMTLPMPDFASCMPTFRESFGLTSMQKSISQCLAGWSV